MTAHPVIRLLHDVGAATWFGGSLMGAIGLNGATAELDDPTERARASTAGWARWAPVAGAGVLAHLVGSAGLTVTDSGRIATQQGVARSSAVKTALEVAGIGVSVWSLALNRAMAKAGPAPVEGATEPGAATPQEVAKLQQQLKISQWANPAVAGALIAVSSWMSEQQRATQVVPGIVKGVTGDRLWLAVPALAALTLGRLAAGRQRSSSTREVTVYPAPVLTSGPDLSPPAPSNDGARSVEQPRES
jgi:hypothetical protein